MQTHLAPKDRFIVKVSVSSGFKMGEEKVISPAEAKTEALRIAMELIKVMDKMEK